MDLQDQALRFISTQIENSGPEIHPHPIASPPISGLDKYVVLHPPQSFSYLVNRNVSKVTNLGTQPCPYRQVEE